MDPHELLDPFERMLAALFPPARVRAIEAGADWRGEWAALAESGFLDAMVAESSGGAGLSLAGALPLLMALGAHAVPLPVGETMIARALLGESVPDGPVALATGCGPVPHGGVCDAVVYLEGGWVYLEAIPPRLSTSGDRAALDGWCNSLPQGEKVADCGEALGAASATLRAASMAGAADRLLAMTTAYANERVQFGKPIGRQQALQQSIAIMAEDCVAVRIAAQLACRRGWPTPTGAAVAKSIASDAAPRIAATAHAVHGAIGISEEFDLQLYTRRLEAWRLADGSASYWNRILGDQVIDSNYDSIDWVRSALFA